MSVRTDDRPDAADDVDAFVSRLRDELRRRKRAGHLARDLEDVPDALLTRLADLLDVDATPLTAADRVGPVFTTERLATLLTPTGQPPRTTEAIRKRAAKHHLVAFRSDDGRWLFPDWQFDRLDGRLQVTPSVVRLWRVLPHGSWLDLMDLAVWMSSALRTLDGPPHRHVRVHGIDGALTQALQRLHARVEGSAA